MPLASFTLPEVRNVLNHRVLLIEDDTIIELGQEVCEVEWSLDFPMLRDVAIT